MIRRARRKVRGVTNSSHLPEVRTATMAYFATMTRRSFWRRAKSRMIRPPYAALVVAALMTLAPGATRPQPQRASEYQLKAVFLFNFAQFVSWPPDAVPEPDAPFVIGILGDDPFGAAIDETVRGERLGARAYLVQRYRRLEDVKRCDILFISRSEREHVPQILAALQHRPLLTVSDADGFLEAGGMIRFVTEQSRVRLRINVAAAQEAHLTLSSKLLRLAETAPPSEH